MPRMIFSDYRKVPNLRQIIKMIDKPRRLAEKRKSRKIASTRKGRGQLMGLFKLLFYTVKTSGLIGTL
jgi:hypothetical protein